MYKKFVVFALVLVSLLTYVGTAGAQRKGPGDHSAMRREVRQYKMKYLAQEIDLKADNQKRFFELYEELEDGRQAIMDEARKLDKQVKADKNATEEDYARAAEAKSAAKVKVSELDKKFDERFSEFLTGKQVYKLHEAEESFRVKMREMHDKKKNGHSSADRKKRGEEL